MASFDLGAPAYAHKSDWADAKVGVNDDAGGFTWTGSAQRS